MGRARDDDERAEHGREDEFEARHMREDGERVLHRDKKVSRGLAAILGSAGLFTWALGAFVVATNGTASKPVPPEALPFVAAAIAAIGLLLMLLALVLGVVRTVVTERDVRVKYGLWGPQIPLEQVRACSVVEYDWTKFGGWGIRRAMDGTWAYVPSPGEVLEIRYASADGKEKRVLVGVTDPREAVRQIERARAGASAGTPPTREPRLRVEDDASEQEQDGLDEIGAGKRRAPQRAKKAR